MSEPPAKRQKTADTQSLDNTENCAEAPETPAAERRSQEDDGDPSDLQDWDLENHILGTLYGNCIGDAIGLLTEFMTKDEAKTYYGKIKELEFEHKVMDMHRNRWEIGDWTDDSDQMILILDSILAKEGKVDPVDFAVRIHYWRHHGFPDLGDSVGNGVGATTNAVLTHPEFRTNPHKAADDVWEANQRLPAPNGAVMRTSILGVHQYKSLDNVIDNTLAICKVVHRDPRCQASCVAVTTAIALMLQRQPEYIKENGHYNIKAIMDKSFELAQKCLSDSKDVSELKQHMFASSIQDLQLAEPAKIGYTYKTMGAGFWALRQKDFRKALTTVVMEAGDADTNGAVAGALLGCKLGYKRLPDSWVKNLKHKDWFHEKITRFLQLANSEGAPKEDIVGEDESQRATETTGASATEGASANESESKDINPTTSAEDQKDEDKPQETEGAVASNEAAPDTTG